MTVPPPPPPAGDYGYPVPPGAPLAARPKISPTWTGLAMLVGAVVAVVAAFLPFEKLTIDAGKTFEISGLGSVSTTGGVPENLFSVGKPGVLPLVVAVIVAVLGLLVVLKLGKLWVSIVALVLSLIGLVVVLITLGNPGRDEDKFRSALGGQLAGSLGIGSVLATIGMAVCAIAALVALVARRPATTT